MEQQHNALCECGFPKEMCCPGEAGFALMRGVQQRHLFSFCPFQDLTPHHCWTDNAYWGKFSASSLSLTTDSLELNTYVSLNTKRARPGPHYTTCCLLSAWRKGANRCRITVQLRETKVHHKINKQPVLQLPQMHHIVPRVRSAL